MINLIAPINTLGYGVAGYNILKQLYSTDKALSLYPIGDPEIKDEIVLKSLENQGQYLASPCLKIWHQHDLSMRIGNGEHIGFPIFELDSFTDIEIKSLNHCDKLFVCSKWAKRVVLSQTKFTDNEVHVVPLGVDTDLFQAEISTRRPKTIFFNCGKWEKRKGHDILLECFNLAFNDADNVELWMMCDNPFIGEQNEQWVNLYKSSPLGDKIRIIPRQQNHQDVYNIMSQADCGVFPARAEGWNLELLEMMACGKHVIATDYSGHTEFCNEENCNLVNVDNMETAFDGVFFNGSHGLWAEMSQTQKDQIISYMRDIHDKKQNGLLSINNFGIQTAENFSWYNSAKEVVNGL